MQTSTTRYHLLIVFLLSLAMGIQIIVIPWLAAQYLALSSFYVGLVQSAVLIPNIALLVIGGISLDKGTLFTRFQGVLLLSSIMHLVFIFLLFQQGLSLLWVVIYGFLLGAVNAFVQPYKEYLAGLFVTTELQAHIAKNRLCLYIGQAAGIFIASQLYQLWLIYLPVIQITALFLVFICLLRIKRENNLLLAFESNHRTEKLSCSLIFSGFKTCWRSTVLRSLLTLTAVNGFLHIGVFIVALPLLVKTVYGSGVELYGFLQGVFTMGMLVSTLVVIYRKQLSAPGRRVIFSVLYSGLILLGISAGPSIEGLVFLVFLWGVVVGVSSTLSRSILQSSTTAAYIGRVISIYQLTLFGFAPLGALFTGFAIDYLGVLMVLKISGIISFVVFAGTFFIKKLWDAETVGVPPIK